MALPDAHHVRTRVGGSSLNTGGQWRTLPDKSLALGALSTLAPRWLDPRCYRPRECRRGPLAWYGLTRCAPPLVRSPHHYLSVEAPAATAGCNCKRYWRPEKVLSVVRLDFTIVSWPLGPLPARPCGAVTLQRTADSCRSRPSDRATPIGKESWRRGRPTVRAFWPAGGGAVDLCCSAVHRRIPNLRGDVARDDALIEVHEQQGRHDVAVALHGNLAKVSTLRVTGTSRRVGIARSLASDGL